MEQSLLMKVGGSVKKYAQVLADVLNIDVDIADNKLYRIAGTGRFAQDVDKPMANYSTAFRKVLETKKSIIIDRPGEHVICLDCPGRDSCMENLEISCPIIVDDGIVGVIALATFDEDKKGNLLGNLPKYMDFLENIADLIAAKVSEYKKFQEQTYTIELLNKLINFINDGVIVFNEDDSLLFINKTAEKLLGFTLSQLNYLQKIKKFSIYKIKSRNLILDVEYIANVKGNKIRLLGNIYPVTFENRALRTVFIFQDKLQLHQKLLIGSHMENYNFDYLIGKDESFLQVKERAKRLASSNMNILISGETGTGKEVFARAIHNESSKRDKSFVTVMCSGMVDTVLEKEVFGFNIESPEDKVVGKIEMTYGGTLFLDEIADLPLRLQGRLMKLILPEKKRDIRVIATTSRDLKRMVENGEFRSDLYYSLDVFSLVIPSVRSRHSDIKLLINYFLEKYCLLEDKQIRLELEVYNALSNYRWPGNVREIASVISLIVNSNQDGSSIALADLPVTVHTKLLANTIGQYNLERMEKEIILKALNIFGNTLEGKRNAAKELGIGTATLYRKLQKYSISGEITFK